jgi:hypothetical protein
VSQAHQEVLEWAIQRIPTRESTDGTVQRTGCARWLHGAVVSQIGQELKGFPVEINGQTLVEILQRVPGEKRLVSRKAGIALGYTRPCGRM